MNRDEIFRIAQEAGLLRVGDNWTEPLRWGVAEIERFAVLVEAAEREECASLEFITIVPEREYADLPPKDIYEEALIDASLAFRAAIRARGNK